MPRIGTVIRDVYRRPGTDDLPAHLERQYGMAVTGSARLAPGVVRVDQAGGPSWVARLSVSSRPAGRVEADAAVLRFAADQGFPAERLAHPEPVSELDGRAVLVTEFLPGRGWPSTPAGQRMLGSLLGRLHAIPLPAGSDPAAAAVGRPAGSLHHLPEYEGTPGQDLAAASALLADIDGRVPAALQPVYDRLLELMPNGDGCAGLPAAFVHPDPARVNVVTTPDGPVLVDWTGAGTGPRLASLAVLLQSAGPVNAAAALAGYQLHQQLTAEELDRLEGALWIRPLWLAAWQLWLAAVSAKVNRAAAPEPAHISALAAAVRAAISS